MVPILLNLDFLLESRHMESDRDCSRHPTGSYFEPEVPFEDIVSDLLEPRFWMVSDFRRSVNSGPILNHTEVQSLVKPSGVHCSEPTPLWTKKRPSGSYFFLISARRAWLAPQ
jgi:hypothetical protein